VLDSQFFGVPQRRARLFVVGHLGDDWRPSAAVLFEPEIGAGNNPPSPGAQQAVTGTVTAGIGKRRGAGLEPELLIPDWPADKANTLDATYAAKYGQNNQHIDNGAPLFVPCWWDGSQIAQTLDAVLYKGQTMPEKNRFPAVLYPLNQIGLGECRSNPQPGDPSPSLTKEGRILVVPGVRRLTPLEAERLQGFPDNYTAIPRAKDKPRYEAIGNSMPVPVMRWIGRRIDIVHRLIHKNTS
jgi:DNA (cytosine-5)-methyltransferase 1